MAAAILETGTEFRLKTGTLRTLEAKWLPARGDEAVERRAMFGTGPDRDGKAAALSRRPRRIEIAGADRRRSHSSTRGEPAKPLGSIHGWRTADP